MAYSSEIEGRLEAKIDKMDAHIERRFARVEKGLHDSRDAFNGLLERILEGGSSAVTLNQQMEGIQAALIRIEEKGATKAEVDNLNDRVAQDKQEFQRMLDKSLAAAAVADTKAIAAAAAAAAASLSAENTKKEFEQFKGQVHTVGKRVAAGLVTLAFFFAYSMWPVVAIRQNPPKPAVMSMTSTPKEMSVRSTSSTASPPSLPPLDAGGFLRLLLSPAPGKP